MTEQNESTARQLRLAVAWAIKTGIDIRGANLSGANMSGDNLRGVNISTALKIFSTTSSATITNPIKD